MHCPNCGKELKDNQKFCGGCGTDVSRLWQKQAAPQAPAAPVPVAQEPIRVAPLPEPVPEPVKPSPIPAPVPEPVKPSIIPAPVPVAAAPVTIPSPAPVKADNVTEPIPVPDREVPEPVAKVEAPVIKAEAPVAPVVPAPVESAPEAPVYDPIPAAFQAAPAPAPVAPAPAPAPEPAPISSIFNTNIPEPQAQPAAKTENAEPAKKGKKGKIGLIIGIVAGAVVLLAGIGVGIWAIVSKAGTPDPTVTVETDETDNVVVTDGNTRTIMVYAIGTDLESEGACLTADVKEMLAANPGDGVNIVLQTGGCNEYHNNFGMKGGITQRFSIIDGNIEELDDDDIKKASMVDAGTLEDFIKFSKENYPADHYILVMWDHGGGVPLSFGFDEVHDGTLTEIEMADAIGNCDIEFESIIFNACLMGSLEVAKALDPYTEYIVAAESPTWGSAYYDLGINYTNFLNYIGGDFKGNAKDYSEFIVRDYMDVVEAAQASSGYTFDTCMSAIDTDNIDEVFEAYEKFIAALDKRVFEQDGYAEYVQIRETCGNFETTDSVDIITLAGKYIDCDDQELKSAASTLTNEVGNCVFTESNNSYTYAHGMTAYAPYNYPEYYDFARATFTTLGYSDATVKFYDKFVSAELYFLNATNYAGSWYVQPAGSPNNGSGNVYDISDLIVNMGDYEAIALTDEDWDIIKLVEVHLAYTLDDEPDRIYYMGIDQQYRKDGNGYIILENPTKWVYFKNFGFVTCYCIDFERTPDGNWTKYLGAEALVNGKEAYVVIASSSADPEGTIIGYYYADILNDTYDPNQGNKFRDDNSDTIVFVAEYYDRNTGALNYYELGDPVNIDAAVSMYEYSAVDYSDVNAYIGFDIFDVYNNDYYIDFRPGTPAYEINIDDEYEQGTTDVTDMIGYVVILKNDTVISDVDCDWVSSNNRIKTDSVYYSDTDELCLAFDVDPSVTQTLYFSFFYSSDNMFSDKEFSKVIYSGSVTPVANGSTYQYQFTLPKSEGIEPGYYYIAISETSGGGNIVYSACQVVS